MENFEKKKNIYRYIYIHIYIFGTIMRRFITYIVSKLKCRRLKWIGHVIELPQLVKLNKLLMNFQLDMTMTHIHRQYSPTVIHCLEKHLWWQNPVALHSFSATKQYIQCFFYQPECIPVNILLLNDQHIL